jgi:hypothetical protein
MRINRILIASVIVLSGLCGISEGQKIYISPSGSDTNPGTADRPLATLIAARDRAREIGKKSESAARIEIVPQSGEYFMLQPLILTPEDSPKPGSSLVIRPENGSAVTFSGGYELKGAEKVNDRLWKIFVPQVAWYGSYFDQLYVDGRRAVRARTPNSGFRTVKKVTESVLINGKDRLPELAAQEISLDPSDVAAIRDLHTQDLGDVVLVFYHKWDNTMKHITAFNDSTGNVITIGKGMQPWNQIDGQSRYFIENYKAALDAPGEWFLDRTGYLYYIPLEGEKIETTRFYAPVLKDLVIIKGDSLSGRKVSNILFENITFNMAGFQLPPEGNEAMQAASPVGAAITADFADNITFRNCEVSHTGTYGIWFRRACSNCSVIHSWLHDLGAGGIKIGETVIRPESGQITSHITIDNNIITDGGKVFPSAVGVIIFNASDNRLTHNEISNFRYSGVSAGWVWGYAPSPTKRNIIEYNHIHHLGWGELCDMGGVYTLGASEGSSVSNNVIHHVYSFDYGGWGLYTDEGSYGITEENNLVYACKSAGFHQHYGKENMIRNNIFALNIRSQLQATRIEDHTSLIFTNNILYYSKGTLLSSNWSKFNVESDYNCYWDTRKKEPDFGMTLKDWRKGGKDVHSVFADPGFVNPEAFDFRFRSLAVAKKIKFKPFDYSKAGVYGSDDWKRKAALDPELAKKFDEIVEQRESLVK